MREVYLIFRCLFTQQTKMVILKYLLKILLLQITINESGIAFVEENRNISGRSQKSSSGNFHNLNTQQEKSQAYKNFAK